MSLIFPIIPKQEVCGGLIARSLYAMTAQEVHLHVESVSLRGCHVLPAREQLSFSAVQFILHQSTLFLVSRLCVDAPSTVALRLPGTTPCLQAAHHVRIPHTSRFIKYSDSNTSRKHYHLRHSCMHIGSRLCACAMMPPFFVWEGL